MKKIRVWVFSILIVVLLSITVFADESVTSSNMFLFGENAISEEQVVGDVYAFAKSIEVLENVNGDVISAGKDIIVKSNKVLGSIRCIGKSVDIYVNNTKNITVAGEKVFIDENSTSNAVYAAGENIEFNGITNDLYLAGNNIVIDGVINGNLEVVGENITIGENAFVYGTIKIKSENEANINGSVAWKDIEYDNTSYKLSFKESNIGIVAKFMNFLSCIIITLLMFVIAKSYFLSLNKELNLYIGKFMLIGLGMIIIIPILIVTLMITAIGLPIGLMLLTALMSILYLSPMYTGIVVGLQLFKNKNIYLQIILGVLIIKLLLMLPYINMIVFLGCGMFMLGSLFVKIKK